MSEKRSTPHLQATGIFAAILKQNRARFNAKFHAAKTNAPFIDGAAFGAHLSTTVAPIVEAIHELQPHRASVAAEELYDLSLSLFAKNILGATPRVLPIASAWRELLPHLTAVLAHEPKKIAGAICNALVQLHETPGARASQWNEEMQLLATQFFLQGENSDNPDFLRAGQIVAWRCGLAHFRSSALQTARELAQKNESLVRIALKIEDASTPLAEILEEAARNPWWTPNQNQSTPRIAGIVGSFHGFAADKKLGAVFVSPPRVVFWEGNFFAVDKQNCWQIFADAFGASFHRVGSSASSPPDASTPAWRILPNGEVANQNGAAQFDVLRSAASFACDANTLAVTLPHSHAIFFVAA